MSYHPRPKAVLQGNSDDKQNKTKQKTKNNTTTTNNNKTVWYWYRGRQGNQWNITEDPEINPHNLGHLIFDKEKKKHTVEKRQHFQQMVLI
jgi:hypothetical protein